MAYRFTFLSILFLMIGACTTGSNNPKKVIKKSAPVPPFKTVTFNEVLDSTYKSDLELTFDIPESFSILTSDYEENRVYWGEEKEIKRAVAFTGPSSRGETGFFKIFVTASVKYDVETDKFTEENVVGGQLKDGGAKEVSVIRKNLGGHPAMIVTADVGGVVVYNCFLATLSGQDVFSIEYYPPIELLGNEDGIWKKVIGGIKRVKVPLKKIKGKDAGDLLSIALKKLKRDKFKLRIYSSLNPELNIKPYISQTILADDSSGFNTSFLQLYSSPSMVLNGTAYQFGSPWNMPSIEAAVKKSGNQIEYTLTLNKVQQPVRKEDYSKVEEKDTSALSAVSFRPVYISSGLDDFYRQVFSIFDIKIVNETKDAYVLQGVPVPDKVRALALKSGMGKNIRGVPVEDELVKLFSLIGFTVSKKTHLPSKISTTGKKGKYPVKTEIEFFNF